MGRLTERDVRTLKLGAVCAVAILVFAGGSKWYDHWRAVTDSLKHLRDNVQDVAGDEVKRAALLQIVPVFEEPKPEQDQKFLFRDKFNEQLKKAGVKTEPLQVIPARSSKGGGYRTMYIKCTGKCKFDQMLDLFAGLKENPYLVGVEEVRITLDSKQPPEKRKDVEIELTVSTFVKSELEAKATGGL